MVTTNKIVTLIKETDYLTMSKIIQSGLFQNANVAVDKTLFKNLVDILVDNKVKKLLEECAVSNPACQGKLDLVPNNIFAFVNFDAVTDGNFTPKIPDIDSEIINALSNKTINEIKLYKLIYEAMKEFAANVKLDISKITNKDLNDYFFLEPVSNFYLFDLLEEKGFLNNVTDANILNTMPAFNLPYKNPYDLIKSDIPAINAAIDDMLNEYPDKEDILETFLKLVDVNNLNVLPAAIVDYIYTEAGLNKLYNLPVLALIIIGYRNLIKLARENGAEDSMLALGRIYNRLISLFSSKLKTLRTSIEKKIVLVDIEQNDKGIYSAGLIKEVFNEIKSEMNDINYNTMFGAIIVAVNNKVTTVNKNDIINNKLIYEDAISKFNKMLTLKNKQEDLTILRSIYRYQISKAIQNMNEQLKSLVIDDNNFKEALLNLMTIDDMVNVDRGSKLVFMNLFKEKTRFYRFLEYVENSIDFLGKDVSSEDAVFIATLQLLTDYILSMVKPV